MIKSPKSLTAIIDIKFHYKEPETKPVDQGEIEILAKIFDQGWELEPKKQEILVKFANYLNHLAGKQTSRALSQLSRRTGNPPFYFNDGALLDPIVICDYQLVNKDIQMKGGGRFQKVRRNQELT